MGDPVIVADAVNMPADTTAEDIAEAYVWGWKMGLKALAIYRDGSKQSQPLSTQSEGDKAKKEKEDGAIDSCEETLLGSAKGVLRFEKTPAGQDDLRTLAEGTGGIWRPLASVDLAESMECISDLVLSNYTVTYTGAETVTLSSAHITLNKTGTATGTVAVSGTGSLAIRREYR